MENFLFGVENIAENIDRSLFLLASSRLVWGFILGFLVSTFLHLFQMNEEEEGVVSSVLGALKSLPSIKKYGRELNLARIAFYGAATAFLLVIALSLLLSLFLQ